MNILACEFPSSSCLEDSDFFIFNSTSGEFSGNFYWSDAYGSGFESYAPSEWTLAADAVAVPTSAPLLGLLGMGWATIRKARKQQHSE